MKNSIYAKRMTVLAAILLSSRFAPVLMAQPLMEAQSATPAPATETAPVQLSAEVWDVVRLARGHASDDTIVAFVKNGGRAYNLGASEILYLRQQGVSDPVVTAMLSQPRYGQHPAA